MRKDVSFPSGGLTLRGWFYEPASPSGKAPVVVMSHGFSAVKEQGLEGFAEAFHRAGFAVLAFDHRHLGASDGADRGRVIPQEQHDDTRAALGWVGAQTGVDPEKIALWGSSYSGGHALFLGALDPRVKAVIAQVPAIDIARSLIAIAGRDGFNGYLHLLAQDHAVRNSGAPGGRIPVVAPPGQPSVLATPDSWDWFAMARTARWCETTSLESVARMAEYLPAANIDLIAPKPLLIMAGVHDSLIPISLVREAFARAGEPKKLIEFEGGHFDLYPGARLHDFAVATQVSWLKSALS